MPAIYPPIAPRGPNAAAPTPPASREIIPQELQSADTGGNAARLAALRADPSTFVDAHHPVRDAVAIALQQPAAALLQRYAMRQRLMREATEASPDSDDPGERAPSLASDDGLPAILAMAETQVAQALLGDAKAFAAIADRVEGKAGLRKADLDAETAAQRERVRSTIEELVRDMSERRRGDNARIIDVDTDET